MTEAQIERQICDFLHAKRYFFWKNTSSGYFDVTKKRFRKHSSPYALNGSPDLILIHLGRFIGLEVKADSGRQSDAQKAFEEKVLKAGGKYFIVRSLEDVENILKSL